MKGWRWRKAAVLVIELWTATYGSMITAAILVYALFPVVHFLDRTIDFRHFNRVLSVQLFPFQSFIGLAVGLAVWEKFDGTFTRWVWTIPLVFLVVHCILFKPGIFEDWWSARIHHFLGSGCRTPECFDQLKYTAPVCTAISYSVGALLGRSGFFRFSSGDF